MNHSKIIGQRQAIVFATLGLLIALLLMIAIVGGAITELIQAAPISFTAAVSALYISAAIFGRVAGRLIYRFEQQRVKTLIVGIGLAESTLLLAVLTGASIEFVINLNNAGAFEDYILKPLGWIMPLGSVAALISGILYSFRVKNLLRVVEKTPG